MYAIRRTDMLAEHSKRCLGDCERVGRVHAELREGGGVGCLPRVVNVEHGSSDDFRTEHVKRRRMHHHGGVNAIESAALELQNLAAGVAHFFGRSADNGYGETDLVSYLGGRNRCADGGGGNDIVAAGVANIG